MRRARVLFDASVLYPPSLRYPLLSLADEDLFDVVWSDFILEEATRKQLRTGRCGDARTTQPVPAMNLTVCDLWER
jgi:hypothetical protein